MMDLHEKVFQNLFGGHVELINGVEELVQRELLLDKLLFPLADPLNEPERVVGGLACLDKLVGIQI